MRALQHVVSVPLMRAWVFSLPVMIDLGAARSEAPRPYPRMLTATAMTEPRVGGRGRVGNPLHDQPAGEPTAEAAAAAQPAANAKIESQRRRAMTIVKASAPTLLLTLAVGAVMVFVLTFVATSVMLAGGALGYGALFGGCRVGAMMSTFLLSFDAEVHPSWLRPGCRAFAGSWTCAFGVLTGCLALWSVTFTRSSSGWQLGPICACFVYYASTPASCP